MNLNLPNNFHRTIIFSHIPVSGNFIYENIFQIVRGNKNLDLLKIGYQEFEPIILEFNSTFFKSFFHPNPSKQNAPFEIFDIYKEVMAILSLIGNANFFNSKYYRVERDELGNDYFKPKFQQKEPENFITLKDDFITKTYNVDTDKVAFPKNCNNFLSNYFKLDSEKTSRYRMSLMLYYNSIDIREFSPSMSFVALISAIENLVDFDSKLNNQTFEKCDSCQQTKYKVTRRFKDFMIKYCCNESPEFKKYLNKIYSKRSNITHIGELLYYDYAKAEIDFEGSREIDTLKAYVRIALYNWIIKN